MSAYTPAGKFDIDGLALQINAELTEAQQKVHDLEQQKKAIEQIRDRFRPADQPIGLTSSGEPMYERA